MYRTVRGLRAGFEAGSLTERGDLEDCRQEGRLTGCVLLLLHEWPLEIGGVIIDRLGTLPHAQRAV